MFVKQTSLYILLFNGEEIVSTYDHPYYVKGKGFVSSEALWIGAKLVDNNGQTLRVEQIYREILDDKTEKVYNFKVDEYHTYFVDEQKILVHNAQGYGNPKPFTEEQQKLLKEAKNHKKSGMTRSQAKDFV